MPAHALKLPRNDALRKFAIQLVLIAIIIGGFGYAFWPSFQDWYKTWQQRHSTSVRVARPLPTLEEREKALALIPSSSLNDESSVPSASLSLLGNAPTITNPLLLARSAKPQDADLIAWLENWRSLLIQNQTLGKVDRDKLSTILAKNQMDCIDLFALANCCDTIPQDSDTAILFCERAAELAHEKLSGQWFGMRPRPILFAMRKSKTILWNALNQLANHDKRMLDALCLMDRDLAVYIPVGDPDLEIERQDSLVGVVQTLMAEERFSDAVSFAKSISPDSRNTWTKDAQWVFALEYGTVLYKNKQYQEAISQLEVAAALPKFPWRQRARIYLYQCYMKTDQWDKANQLAVSDGQQQ